MKSYKNVEMFAKNSPAGAYAAGCPVHSGYYSVPGGTPYCSSCEVAF